MSKSRSPCRRTAQRRPDTLTAAAPAGGVASASLLFGRHSREQRPAQLSLHPNSSICLGVPATAQSLLSHHGHRSSSCAALHSMIVTDFSDTSLTVANDGRYLGAERAAPAACARAPAEAQHRRRLFGHTCLATHDLMSCYSCASWGSVLGRKAHSNHPAADRAGH